MKKDTIQFKDYQDLLVNLGRTLPYVHPNTTRDLVFFLQEFGKQVKFPDDTKIYIGDVSLEEIEVTSFEKVSESLLGGAIKSQFLNRGEKGLPPVVVVKGGVRSIMVYGEPVALESYIRKSPLKAIIFEVDDPDPHINVLNIQEWQMGFFLPLVQSELLNLQKK